MKEKRKNCTTCGGKGYLLKKNEQNEMYRKTCICQKANIDREVRRYEVSARELEEKVPSDYYRAVDFDGKILRETIPIESEYDFEIEGYISFLEEYIENMITGEKPKKSYYVVAPPDCGKKIFVYTAIKEAMAHGLQVSGLVDTQEIYEKLEERAYREIRELYKNDIVFVTVGNSPSKADMVAIRYLIDIADRMGTPMLMISRYNATFICQNDPTLLEDIGVMSSRKGAYGKLEFVGFNRQILHTHKMKLEQQYKKKKAIQGEDILALKQSMREQ